MYDQVSVSSKDIASAFLTISDAFRQGTIVLRIIHYVIRKALTVKRGPGFTLFIVETDAHNGIVRSCIGNSNGRGQNMNPMKSGLLIALVIGMIFLAILGFNLTTVYAHGHGGGGNHHGEHSHEHYRGGEHRHDDGSDYDSHYDHSHDDYNDHYHPCRSTQGSGAAAGEDQRDPSNEECQNHNGEWEPSGGD
jgi:hypothetical protein